MHLQALSFNHNPFENTRNLVHLFFICNSRFKVSEPYGTRNLRNYRIRVGVPLREYSSLLYLIPFLYIKPGSKNNGALLPFIPLAVLNRKHTASADNHQLVIATLNGFYVLEPDYSLVLTLKSALGRSLARGATYMKGSHGKLSAGFSD